MNGGYNGGSESEPIKGVRKIHVAPLAGLSGSGFGAPSGKIHTVRSNKSIGHADYTPDYFRARLDDMSEVEMRDHLKRLANRLNNDKTLNPETKAIINESIKLIDSAIRSINQSKTQEDSELAYIQDLRRKVAENLFCPVPNWPENAHYGSMELHNHFVHLLQMWRTIDGTNSNSHDSRIDSRAESEGKTAIYFGSVDDANQFVKLYRLAQFVEMSGTTPVMGSERPGAYIQFRNRFPRNAFDLFMDDFLTRMARLQFIWEEAERVVEMTGGSVSFPSAHFFWVRSAQELRAIVRAREILAASRL